MNGTKLQRIGILLLIIFALGATAWNMWGSNTKSVELKIQQQGEGEIKIKPQKDKYEIGEEIQLSAQAQKGWEFVKWSGSINKTEKTINTKVEENMTINPVFEKEKYTIEIEKNGDGKITVRPDKEYYALNEKIKLEAQPDEGWTLTKWGGDIESTNRSIELTVEENMTIKPLFEKNKYSLNINIEGKGTYELDPDKEKYEYEEEVTVTAVPKEGWQFVNWTGDIKSEHKSADLKIDKDTSISPKFEKREYTLNTEIEGDGNIIIDPDKEKYEYKEEVTVTAEPAAGWEFIEWTGDIKSEHKSTDIKITDEMIISPIFEKKEYELNVETQGQGNISIEPDKAKYEYEEEVTLTADPKEGWKFVEWTGDIKSEHKSVDINVTEDMSIEPSFEKIQYKVEIGKTGQGSVKIHPDHKYYHYGDTIALEAEPAEGWNFIQWSGDISKESDTIEIEVTDDIKIKTIFESEKFEININNKGEGTVSLKPTKEKYNYNEEIILKAEPAEGWNFFRWSGDINSQKTTYKLNIKKDLQIRSIFKSDDNVVQFKDPRLEEIIRKKINQPDGKIYVSMVENITKIEAAGKSIKSLAGIEVIKSLEYLDISKKWVEGTWNYNFISNIKPLSNLENLNYLDLSNNNIKELTPLVNNKGLTKDDYINLKNNKLKIVKGSQTMENIEKLKSRGIKIEF